MWLLLIVNLAGKAGAIAVARSSPVAAVALFFVPDALLAYHLFAPWAQGLLRVHRRFATPRREVWLTIDDGPDPDDTPRILELLAAHGAKVTFFVIGQNAAANPELVSAIVAGGHEVGHHTQTHPLGSFWLASPGRLARELDDCLVVLRAAGVKPTRFRPPAVIKNLWLKSALAARNLVCVGWSSRGLERWGGDPDVVVARTLRGVGPGSILLLHEGPQVPPSARVRAISGVLDRLKAEGYRCIVPDPDQLVG